MNNYKDKFGIYYHIFCDNQDYYEHTKCNANLRFNNLKKEGQSNIRLYQYWFDTKEHAIQAANGDYSCDSEISECIRSFGGWPT